MCGTRVWRPGSTCCVIRFLTRLNQSVQVVTHGPQGPLVPPVPSKLRALKTDSVFNRRLDMLGVVSDSIEQQSIGLPTCNLYLA